MLLLTPYYQEWCPYKGRGVISAPVCANKVRSEASADHSHSAASQGSCHVHSMSWIYTSPYPTYFASAKPLFNRRCAIMLLCCSNSNSVLRGQTVVFQWGSSTCAHMYFEVEGVCMLHMLKQVCRIASPCNFLCTQSGGTCMEEVWRNMVAMTSNTHYEGKTDPSLGLIVWLSSRGNWTSDCVHTESMLVLGITFMSQLIK